MAISSPLSETAQAFFQVDQNVVASQASTEESNAVTQPQSSETVTQSQVTPEADTIEISQAAMSLQLSSETPETNNPAPAQETETESTSVDSTEIAEVVAPTPAVANNGHEDQGHSHSAEEEEAPNSTNENSGNLFNPLRPFGKLGLLNTSKGIFGRRNKVHKHGDELPVHDHPDSPEVLDKITSHTRIPDLRPWMVYTKNAKIETDRESGKKLLSFGTTISNVGNGPLELAIEGTKEDERRPAFQVLKNDDGTEIKIPVGEVFWHDAPGHNHYHFDEFAQYQLRAVGPDGEPGEIVREGHKAGFCLMDSIQSHPDTPTSGVTPTFRGTSCKTGENMGISAGWSDHYAARQGLKLLDGQFIEIDGVEPGEYYLEITADPANRLIEKNQDNNTGRVKITIE